MPREKNRLLAVCSDRDFALLEPYFEPVQLAHRLVLEEPDQPIEHIYFPVSGIGSIIAISPEGEKVEVGLCGCEGMSGTAVVNGADRTPLQTFIQIPGEGVRIERVRFEAAIRESASLHALFLLYGQAFSIQVAYTALSNGRHTLEERLARWILMCHDRSVGDELPLTHEFLALMLGVRRAGVTTGLHILEGAQIIRATRGLIQLRDRAKLEAAAGDAYGEPEREYLRLFTVYAASQPG